jgi:tetratricopeptide (TPR) repeat protein
MTHQSYYWGRASAIILLLTTSGLAGCARFRHAPPPPPVVVAEQPPTPPAYAAPADMNARDRLLRVIKLLESGNADHARVDVQAYLFQNPKSLLANSLLEQIDRDPMLLLGAEHYVYEVRAEESLSQLAERFLGDRYKFWALARYNDIANPTKLAAGQRLKIPGVPKPIVNVSKPVPGDEEEIARRLAEEQQEKREVIKPEPPKPLSIIDPVRAMALRKIGLENLQRGKIDAAISMLKQALDMALGTPSLGVIQKDLARALRLKASIRR